MATTSSSTQLELIRFFEPSMKIRALLDQSNDVLIDTNRGFRVGRSKGATASFTAPAYYKFEPSGESQQTFSP